MIKFTHLLLISLFFFFCKENTERVIAEKNKPKKNSVKIITWSKPKPGIFTSFSYSKLNKRKPYELMNDSLKKIIDRRFKNSGIIYMDSLIDFILDLTKEQLTFSFEKCEKSPNKLVRTKKANCIGYAAYFCSLMNYALEIKGLTKQYRCHHYVGKIYCSGQDLTGMFNDPFFKDHDYNTITDRKSGTEIALDPSLYEYLGVKRVLLKVTFSTDKHYQFPKPGVPQNN